MSPEAPFIEDVAILAGAVLVGLALGAWIAVGVLAGGFLVRGMLR